MASLVVARLGSVEFSVSAGALDRLERHTRWRIDQPDPVDGMGRPTSRGRGRDEITISGVVFPGLVGRADSVERLRDLGDSGESHTLSDGEGKVYGSWMVVAVRESQTAFLPTGPARRRAYDLTLTADPDDGLVPL